ncbi:aldehyde dehydrogenase family protein [Microvirga pudoricolor]|uniref:aldehyde dehydrogenase family protein n=1 Tax=Microvirga pudoricolor TaxID=2778729 RepID=UPI00194FD116|nr:aldehyde dehydrogenase family protein [Microvirga pudoricolor]MBM6595218.1 aldehyde dehydrogenase family protein [Microvirga pudoricolor]
MRSIDTIYIDGSFVTPRGEERFDLFNPSTSRVIGQVRLGNAQDAGLAIAAARRAFPSFSRTRKADRITLLRRLHEAVAARTDRIAETMIEEYGAPVSRAAWAAGYAAQSFLDAASTLETYPLERRIGSADVVLEPVGVAGLITPWNANAGFICNKLAFALAAGCTAVIKPSEMSALQTQVVAEALHEAGLPDGVFNIVNGRGDVVGAELARHPDIAKISFTGSTAVGKSIMRAGAETLKRITLELGGKSPTLILEDADLDTAIPLAVRAGFINSGQACLAGTRILVPESRKREAEERLRTTVEAVKVGDPRNPETAIGPMVSLKQWERVQRYIRVGLEEGARIVVGGEGKPDGLEGYFVRPTVFSDVQNHMTIAREEIFGPVLSLITYKDEEDAITIANDTVYGLQACVISKDDERARAVASRIAAGRVLVNGLHHEPLAPFGGFKQSGIGREHGPYGLEAYLEPKTLLGSREVAQGNDPYLASAAAAPSNR